MSRPATEKMRIVALDDRALLRLGGADRVDFLQGLVSNDVKRLEKEPAIYAALLSPQGKLLFDFFVIAAAGHLLIDCPASQSADLMRRLLMYRLRAAVDIDAVGDQARLYAALPTAGGTPPPTPDDGVLAYRDPRDRRMGWRLIAGEAWQPDGNSFRPATIADYRAVQMALAIPDSTGDLRPGKDFPAECNFERLNAVDFDKGCFIGQELTARIHYRGKLKKRLIALRATPPLPAGSTDMAITLNGREVGHIRSARGSLAMAMCRVGVLEGSGLRAGDSQLSPLSNEDTADE